MVKTSSCRAFFKEVETKSGEIEDFISQRKVTDNVLAVAGASADVAGVVLDACGVPKGAEVAQAFMSSFLGGRSVVGLLNLPLSVKNISKDLAKANDKKGCARWEKRASAVGDVAFLVVFAGAIPLLFVSGRFLKVDKFQTRVWTNINKYSKNTMSYGLLTFDTSKTASSVLKLRAKTYAKTPGEDSQKGYLRDQLEVKNNQRRYLTKAQFVEGLLKMATSIVSLAVPQLRKPLCGWRLALSAYGLSVKHYEFKIKRNDGNHCYVCEVKDRTKPPSV